MGRASRGARHSTGCWDLWINRCGADAPGVFGHAVHLREHLKIPNSPAPHLSVHVQHVGVLGDDAPRLGLVAAHQLDVALQLGLQVLRWAAANAAGVGVSATIGP